MKIFSTLSIVVFSILAFIALISENYASFFVQLVPTIYSVLYVAFPNSRILKILGSPISPKPVNGMLSSVYSAQMLLFSSKIAMLITVLWSSGFILVDFIERSGFLMGIFAMALPLLFFMALFVALFHAIKLFIIKITGNDREFCDIDDDD